MIKQTAMAGLQGTLFEVKVKYMSMIRHDKTSFEVKVEYY